MQLHDAAAVRHGIMLVGPSGSGKTAVCDTLAAALTDMGTKTVVWRMNPKALTAPQMFGRMDAATGDWTDGVFAALWRRAAKKWRWWRWWRWRRCFFFFELFELFFVARRNTPPQPPPPPPIRPPLDRA